MKSLFLTLFCLISMAATAQVDQFQKEIVDLLNINGVREDCSVAFHEVFPTLKKNFEKRNVPEEAWEKLKEDEDTHLDKAVNDLAFAYRKYFTQEDIAAMNEFFQTDAAQKSLAGKELNEEEDKEVKKYLKSDVGKKIKDVNDDLRADMKKIMDQFKRDVFGAKMKQLVKGGYL